MVVGAYKNTMQPGALGDLLPRLLSHVSNYGFSEITA